MDTIIGAGIRGPYYLSRTGLAPHSDVVTLDGERQAPGLDYVFDPAGGMVIFGRTIRAGDLIQVRYWYDPSASKEASKDAARTALDVPLLGIGSTSVHFLGSYAHGTPGHDAGQGLSGLGAAITESLGKAGSLGARLLVAPHPSSAADPTSPVVFSSHESAEQLNGQFNLAALRMCAGWSQSGKEFTPTDAVDKALAPGTTPGAHSFDWTLAGPLTRQASLDAGYSHKDGQGAATRDEHLKLGYTGARGSMTVSYKDAADGTGTDAHDAADAEVGVQQKIGAVVVSTDVQRQGDRKADSSSATTIETVGVTATPRAGVTLGVIETKTDASAAPGTQKQEVSLTAGQILTSHASYQQQDAGHVDETRTEHLDTKVQPLKGLDVSLKTDNSASIQSGESGLRSVAVQVDPKAPLKVAASLSEKYAGKDPASVALVDQTVGTTVAVDPNKSLHLGAGYEQDRGATTIERDRSLDTRVALVNAMDVSGSIIDRSSDSKDLPDTASVGVQLHAARILSLDASYTQNPQDPTSRKITESVQRSVGVHSVLGLLDVTGKYSLSDPAGSSPPILSRQLDMGLKIGAGGRLFSSYQSSSQPLDKDGSLFRYQVGFTHSVGDIFSLSLTGQLNSDQPGIEGVRSGLKDDSQAKVGFSARW